MTACHECRAPIPRGSSWQRVDRGAQVCGERLSVDRDFCSPEHYAQWLVDLYLERYGAELTEPLD